MKTRTDLKYFVNDCLRKHFFDSNSAQTLPNVFFFFLTILAALRSFTLLQHKKRAMKLPYLVTDFPIFSLRLKIGVKIISSLL